MGFIPERLLMMMMMMIRNLYISSCGILETSISNMLNLVVKSIFYLELFYIDYSLFGLAL